MEIDEITRVPAVQKHQKLSIQRETLEAAARFCRGGLNPAPDHDSTDLIRSAKVRTEQARLVEWAKANHKLGRTIPEVDGSGGEHLVWFEHKSQRFFKATSKSQRGYGIALGSHCRGATPAEYLDRILLQNELMQDDIRLEQVVLRDRVPVIITSQRWIKGAPTPPQYIDTAMKEQGYEKLTEGTFYLPARELLAFDVFPRNALSEPGGEIAVFDPVIQRVTADFVDFIRAEPSCMRYN